MSQGRRDWTRVANLGLAGVVLVLAVLLVMGLVQWMAADNGPEGPSASKTAARKKTSSKTILAAKLSGDPFKPKSKTSAEVKAPDLGITILGVVLGPEEAFVLAKTSGSGAQVQKVMQGDALGPYLLVEIGPEVVVFKKGQAGPKREVRWRKHDDYLSGEAPPPPALKDEIVRMPGDARDKTEVRPSSRQPRRSNGFRSFNRRDAKSRLSSPPRSSGVERENKLGSSGEESRPRRPRRIGPGNPPRLPDQD